MRGHPARPGHAGGSASGARHTTPADGTYGWVWATVGDGAVRSSVNGLTATARAARHETGEVADAVRAAMDGLGRIGTSLPRHEAGAREAAVHDITGDMLSTIEHLEQEVTSTIDDHVADLESPLRPRRLRRTGRVAFHRPPGRRR